jgi:hypothetical protein
VPDSFIPAVSLGCITVQVIHEAFESGEGENLFLFPSYLEGRGFVWVWGTTEQMTLELVIGGVNRGQPVEAALTDLGPADDFTLDGSNGNDAIDTGTDPDPLPLGSGVVDSWQEMTGGQISDNLLRVAIRWTAGVDGVGQKPVNSVIVRSPDGEADMTSQTRDALGGKNLKVRFPQADTFGECPEDFTDFDPSATPDYLPIILR